jgi:hypothetical protein
MIEGMSKLIEWIRLPGHLVIGNVRVFLQYSRVVFAPVRMDLLAVAEGHFFHGLYTAIP